MSENKRLAAELADTRPQEGLIYAILAHVEAVERVAAALRALGTGNAASAMGAIEYLATQIKEGADGIASALTSD